MRWWHPDAGDISPSDLYPDRRGDRPYRAARRMDPAHRLRLCGDLASATRACRQPLAGAVQDPGCRGTASCRCWPKPALSRTAGAGNYRIHRFFRTPTRCSTRSRGSTARRFDRHGRFRHRLFEPVLPQSLPGQEDQDRSLLHRYARGQPADQRHRFDRSSASASRCT